MTNKTEVQPRLTPADLIGRLAHIGHQPCGAVSILCGSTDVRGEWHFDAGSKPLCAMCSHEFDADPLCRICREPLPVGLP